MVRNFRSCSQGSGQFVAARVNALPVEHGVFQPQRRVKYSKASGLKKALLLPVSFNGVLIRCTWWRSEGDLMSATTGYFII